MTKYYLSTIATDAVRTAKAYGLGLEIAEYSKVPVMDWLEVWTPYISHFHVHNNDGSRDQHSALFEGDIPIRQFLARAEELCPDATFTLELMKTEPSVRWLLEE